MSPRTRTMLVLALFIPAAVLLLLASIGSIRGERNQREEDLSQRRQADENRWWAEAESKLAESIGQRFESLRAWPSDLTGQNSARRAELVLEMNPATNRDRDLGFLMIIDNLNGEGVFPPRVEIKRTDDILQNLDSADRQKLRRAWHRIESGETTFDPNLASLFLDAGSKQALIALTSYYRCIGRSKAASESEVESAKGASPLEWELYRDGFESLPTAQQLNLLDRLASGNEGNSSASESAAQLILEVEGLAAVDPLFARSWVQARSASSSPRSQRIGPFLTEALDRADIRRAHRNKRIVPTGGADKASTPLEFQGMAGLAARGENQSFFAYINHIPSAFLPPRPAGLRLRELVGPTAMASDLTTPGGFFGKRRYEITWDRVAFPLPWTTMAIIAVSALALIGLAVGSMVALRSMERERTLLNTRAEFLAAVSHQLKTPVANLRLFAETLAGDRAPEGPDQARMLAILKSESEKLGHQLQRIMGVARLDAPLDTEADSGRVSVKDIVSEVSERWRGRLELKGGQIKTDGLDQDEAILGNRELLVEAIDNLVSNAVEHGGAAGTVGIRMERSSKFVSLLVQDRGPGIDAADGERVFERFYRAEGSRKRRGEGTGLGLWIARRIAKRHGGRLTIAETSPQGTTMRLELRAAPTGELSA